ncbi:unnamed protein product [Heligmosomoides polygyrus]|uniref:Zinc carboxypeptidase A 1 n=1 Tax=Heligmosomoides polygyrus TaxID=6339 RepID=A0A3P7XJ93_HELPZ|nr:unnamed protein product [Heligmosomoides polygyrus]
MLLWLVCTYLSLVAASIDDDDGYRSTQTAALNRSNCRPFKVFRVVPTTSAQLKRMIALFETAKGDEADFWHAPSVVNSTIDVMVSPTFTEKFAAFLKQHDYPYHIAIEDLKKNFRLLIEKEGSIKMNTNGVQDSDLVRLHDDTGAFVSKLRMGEYYSYSTIVEWMKRIADHMPDVAKVIDIGSSTEGRPILGMQFGVDSPHKKVVVIDAGIHAREWAAVHTGMYFINLMVNGRDDDPKIRSYLDNIVVYIFPVLNPDGYEYTRSDKTNPRARMWRKSRSAKACAFDGISNACCQGVDLNRNFDFRFAEIGASRYPCSEIYHGATAFSEPESRAFSNFLISLGSRLEAYITLHAYSQLWIYSYSHRKFTYAPDIDETKRVAQKAVAELGKLYGTRYRYGTGPEIIYAFSGGSTDWAKEKLKVKYSYTIELRPTYEGIIEWNGFVLDKNQLIPTAKETWAGVSVVLDEIISQTNNNRAQAANISSLQRQRCSDRLDGCKRWVETTPQICSASPQSMARDCAKTCNLCHLIKV